MSEEQKEHFKDLSGNSVDDFLKKIRTMDSVKASAYIQERKRAFEVFYPNQYKFKKKVYSIHEDSVDCENLIHIYCSCTRIHLKKNAIVPILVHAHPSGTSNGISSSIHFTVLSRNCS